MNKIFTFMSFFVLASSPMLHSETLKVYDHQSISNSHLGDIITGIGFCGMCVNMLQALKDYGLGELTDLHAADRKFSGFTRSAEVEVRNLQEATTLCRTFSALSFGAGVGSYLTMLLGASLSNKYNKPALTLSEENKSLCYQGITVSFDNITHIEKCNNAILVHISPEAEIPGNIIVIDTKKLDIKMHKLIRTLKELLETNKTNGVIFSRKSTA